jgi:hypothetical protein
MIRALPLAALLAAAATTAQAATWTLNVTGPMELGTVVAGQSGDTVFHVDAASGSVTVPGGGGRRLTGAPAHVRVEVSCRPSPGGDTACQTTSIPIRIGVIGATTGRARAFTAFNVSMDGGSIMLAGPITGSNPLMFTLAPLGDNIVRSFHIGADFPVAGDDTNLPTGLGENLFYVYALNEAGATSAGDNDKGKVIVLRSLSIGPASPLRFGRIQIPTTGTSTVRVDAGLGTRSVDGTAFAYPTPAPSPAAFTVAGEGGQQISINVPSSLQLSGPEGALTVALSDTAPASTILPGTLGSRPHRRYCPEPWDRPGPTASSWVAASRFRRRRRPEPIRASSPSAPITTELAWIETRVF